MSAVATAGLEPQLSKREVELVVHHEQRLGLDLEERGGRAHAAPGGVHERLGLQQPKARSLQLGLRVQPIELGPKRRDAPTTNGKRVDHEKPSIVPSPGVTRPRIPEADDQNHFLAGALAAAPLAGAAAAAPAAGAAAPAAGAAAAPATGAVSSSARMISVTTEATVC